jgi:hypothetical protein
MRLTFQILFPPYPSPNACPSGRAFLRSVGRVVDWTSAGSMVPSKLPLALRLTVTFLLFPSAPL